MRYSLFSLMTSVTCSSTQLWEIFRSDESPEVHTRHLHSYREEKRGKVVLEPDIKNSTTGEEVSRKRRKERKGKGMLMTSRCSTRSFLSMYFVFRVWSKIMGREYVNEVEALLQVIKHEGNQSQTLSPERISEWTESGNKKQSMGWSVCVHRFSPFFSHSLKRWMVHLCAE